MSIKQEKDNDAFLAQYNPKLVEDRIYKLWEESGFFVPEAHSPLADNSDNAPRSIGHKLKAKSYTIAAPPPNITGSLHMGHALNATIQDILIRKKRMEGYKTLWLPGTDHAGIATQNVVEKDLKKQGLSRHDLGREKFLASIWGWKEKYGGVILRQFKKLGVSMDWSRTRFTMDEEYQKAVSGAFLHYHKKGWLYRAERVINWCVRCQTSLSDLELEYREAQGVLYYIRYPITERHGTSDKIQEYITVATVRPETMLGDSAVAVNPKDARYADMVGKKATLPIQNREVPIITDDAVELNFGTGAVKVTPAHDFADADMGERHNLPFHKIIDERGKMTGEAGAICGGLKIGECRDRVVAELKKEGLIEKEEPYRHNVAMCYRCNTVIEPMLSMQWFLKMKELARMALDAAESGKIRFHPERWKEVYIAWLKNVRDWNVSRQIWWGHRIPVWYDITLLDNKHGKIKFKMHSLRWDTNAAPVGSFSDNRWAEFSEITNRVNAGEWTWAKIKDAIEVIDVSRCRKPELNKNQPAPSFVQDPDVLDTWFSSALWPFATLGWPEKTKDLAEFYPTQVLSTARDIINLWVGRMVFSGLEFMGEVPFSDVIIHATILTKEGKRMSKSLGTGIDPMLLVEKYGADAARFGLVWQAMGGQDAHWSEEHIIAGKKFCNKIWNATRFVLAQLITDNLSPITTPVANTDEDKKILEGLENVKKEVSDLIDAYEFGQALHILYDFFWHEFCDVYLEAAKKQLKTDDLQLTTREVLLRVLSESLKLLHPFMPFITEEIWVKLPIKDRKMLIVEEWPR